MENLGGQQTRTRKLSGSTAAEKRPSFLKGEKYGLARKSRWSQTMSHAAGSRCLNTAGKGGIGY